MLTFVSMTKREHEHLPAAGRDSSLLAKLPFARGSKTLFMKNLLLIHFVLFISLSASSQSLLSGKAMEDAIIRCANINIRKRTEVQEAKPDEKVREEYKQSQANVKLYKAKAEKKMSQGDYKGAVLDLDEAILNEDFRDKKVNMLRLKAKCYEKLSQYADAAWEYEVILQICYEYKDENNELNKSIPRLYYDIGISYIKSGDTHNEAGCYFLTRANELGCSLGENIRKKNCK